MAIRRRRTKLRALKHPQQHLGGRMLQRRGWLVVFAALSVLGLSRVSADALTCEGKVATIVGTPGDDVIYGTDDDDVIVGRGGDDVIYGLGGNDTICGGGGNDTLVGGDGNDPLRGGSGDDILIDGNDSCAVPPTLPNGQSCSTSSECVSTCCDGNSNTCQPPTATHICI
jgi:hypothetical protein